jgi:hypothetical protein
MAGAGAGAGGDPLVLQQDRPHPLICYYALRAPPARRGAFIPVVLGGQNEIDGVARLSIRDAIRWRRDLASQRPGASPGSTSLGRQALALFERQISATRQEYPWVGLKPRSAARFRLICQPAPCCTINMEQHSDNGP